MKQVASTQEHPLTFRGNIWLAVDTSQPEGTLALLLNKQIVYAVKFFSPQGHTENLLTVVAGALEYARVDWAHVQKILVTRGPGSFTGLRVVLSHLKGMLWGESFKIESILTTQALALGSFSSTTTAASPPQLVLSLLNAQKNQVYFQIFESTAMLKKQEVGVATISDVCSMMTNLGAASNSYSLHLRGFIPQELKEWVQQKRALFKEVDFREWQIFNLAEQMLLHRLSCTEGADDEQVWQKHTNDFPQIEYVRLPEAFALIQLRKKI